MTCQRNSSHLQQGSGPAHVGTPVPEVGRGARGPRPVMGSRCPALPGRGVCIQAPILLDTNGASAGSPGPCNSRGARRDSPPSRPHRFTQAVPAQGGGLDASQVSVFRCPPSEQPGTRGARALPGGRWSVNVDAGLSDFKVWAYSDTAHMCLT